MPKVKVLNENTHPLKCLFKGDPVEIASQDYWRGKDGKPLVMDMYEANDFKGQYHPVPVDTDGKMIRDQKYFKMIKLEVVEDGAAIEDEDEAAPTGFKCMARECKHVSPSPEELEAHTTVRHANADRLVLPEEDVAIKKRGRPPKAEKQSA